MTNAERGRVIQEAQAKFYAWEPGGIDNPFQQFKCWHIEPYPRMSNDRCRARAKKPELYEGAGCSLACPRWKHYRKLFKKEAKDDGIIRRAYPPDRSQPNV